MKVFKLEITVIDFENYGQEEIKNIIESVKYLQPSVLSVDVADIGEWHDGHPLNKHSTHSQECKRLFDDDSEINELKAENERLRETLKRSLETLKESNIRDTIWYSDCETLFDFMQFRLEQ